MNITDINYLNIFPYVGKVSTIEVSRVELTGGVLRAGNYTFAIRYLDDRSNPTNFFNTTQPVALPQSTSRVLTSGSPAEERVGGKIILQIDNLDVVYDRFQIAVIPQYDGVIGTPVLLPPLPINALSSEFIYDGTEPGVESSLEEILINTASYKRAEAINQVDDVLYLGNMTKHDPLDYQRFANNIKVKAVTQPVTDKIMGGSGSISTSFSAGFGQYQDFLASDNPEKMSYEYKGFKRGNAYAFYISFILDDGTESPAYHIPGRPAGTIQYLSNTYPENGEIPFSPSTLNLLSIAQAVNPNSTPKWYQFLSPPDSDTGLGYWENQNERYTSDDQWQIWDVDSEGEPFYTGQTLQGNRVRHHQIPENDYNPYVEPGQDDAVTARIMGVTFENIKIPKYLKDRVKAIRFHYAKPDVTNRRILDMSFGNAVFTSGDTWKSGIDNSVHNPEAAPNNAGHPVLLHPFDSLRTRQNLRGVTHLRSIGWNNNTPTDLLNIPVPTGHTRKLLNFINGTTIQPPAFTNRWHPVLALSYLNSTTFNEDDANDLIDIRRIGFPKNFDNTNGEEKILVGIGTLLANPNEPYPNILYELCQFKEDVFTGFDAQELVYIGKTFTDIDNFDPENASASFATGPVFGGDTFIGAHTTRHSLWINEGDTVRVNLRMQVIESFSYPRYRHVGQQPWEGFFPIRDLFSYSSIIWRNSSPAVFGKEGDVFPQDTINYNTDYLMNESVKQAFPKPKRPVSIIEFPTRVVRSRQALADQEVDLFRQFREEDYIDLPANKGALRRLTVVNNILVPHMERTMFRTRGREELATDDFRAFLGSGDIFSVKPEELIQSDTGYGGIQHRLAGVVTDIGYFFVDQIGRKVFHLGAEGLAEISRRGMRTFFEKHLKFNFEPYGFRDIYGASPYFFLELEWDPVFKRLLIHKRDMRFVPGQSLDFDEDLQMFVDEQSDPVEWDNTDYFEPDFFTISYQPELEVWTSFHDYNPQLIFGTANKFMSINNEAVHEHHKGTPGNFYDTVYESYIQYIDNRSAEVAKTVSGLFINSEVATDTKQSLPDKTVTHVRVSNTSQDTGLLEVKYFQDNGNARRAQGFWRINQLRNMKDNNGVILEERPWYDKEWLSDRYHYVTLFYDNEDGNQISIASSELNYKPSLR